MTCNLRHPMSLRHPVPFFLCLLLPPYLALSVSFSLRLFLSLSVHELSHTAPCCNALQHTATYCNTLQHTATHCYTLLHTATHCNTLLHTATHCNTHLWAIQPHCNTLQHTPTHSNTLQHTPTHASEPFSHTSDWLSRNLAIRPGIQKNQSKKVRINAPKRSKILSKNIGNRETAAVWKLVVWTSRARWGQHFE